MNGFYLSFCLPQNKYADLISLCWAPLNFWTMTNDKQYFSIQAIPWSDCFVADECLVHWFLRRKGKAEKVLFLRICVWYINVKPIPINFTTEIWIDGDSTPPRVFSAIAEHESSVSSKSKLIRCVSKMRQHIIEIY